MQHNLFKMMTKAGAVAAAVSLLMAGCASGGSVGGDDTELGAVGVIGTQSETGDPVDGGVLSFASYSPITTLSPIKGRPSGFLGGTEMAAVYDLMMRYDAATDAYVPQLAQSLTESPDHLTWTLRLRPDVKFSDGTPLDAAAVVFATNLYNEGGGSGSELFTQTVTAVEAVDPVTVEYRLSRPWAEFPATLVSGYGMIPAPSSYAGGEFTPIGAGPFTLDKFTPGSEVLLKANPTYWGGKPHLDSLKFVEIQGEQAKLDALKSGGIQAAYLRKAATVNAAKAEFPGYYESVSVTDAMQINSREGRPGSDLRVRQAISMALDPELMIDRARGGEGQAGTGLFEPWSEWYADVPDLGHDLDAARTLLDQAKADGYDGNLVLVTPQTPDETDASRAAQAMLQNVGFTVDVRYISTLTDLVRTLFITHDFDLSNGGWGVDDAVPVNRLYGALASGSRNNVGGFSDPQVDQALIKVQTATTDEERKHAFAELQTLFNETVPFVVWGSGANFVPWAPNVHGVKTSTDGLTLFDQAWIAP